MRKHYLMLHQKSARAGEQAEREVMRVRAESSLLEVASVPKVTTVADCVQLHAVYKKEQSPKSNGIINNFNGNP